jgi:hypothetical protein
MGVVKAPVYNSEVFKNILTDGESDVDFFNGFLDMFS